MKLKKILSAVLVSGLLFSFAACSNKTQDKPAPETKETVAESKEASKTNTTDKELQVSVVLKTTASEYWGYVVAGANAYGKDHPDVKVTVSGAANETAYDEQLAMIETEISKADVDAFVFAPLQADMVANVIANIEKPVIAVDTKIDSPKVLSFVGTGNEAAAKLGGTEAVKAAKAAGWQEIKAIAISGVQGDTTCADRLTGYQKGIEEAGGTYLVDETQYADAVADKAVTIMEGIMQTHPEGIAIIVCNNDDIAIGAARAAKNNEAYKNTVFVGFDGIISACDAILKGEETLSVAQEGFNMGYKAVEAAVKAVRGETIEKFIDSGASVVNPENAAERKATLEGYLGK